MTGTYIFKLYESVEVSLEKHGWKLGAFQLDAENAPMGSPVSILRITGLLKIYSKERDDVPTWEELKEMLPEGFRVNSLSPVWDVWRGVTTCVMIEFEVPWKGGKT